VFCYVVVLEPVVVDAFIGRGLFRPVLGHDMQFCNAAVYQEDATKADGPVSSVLGTQDCPDGLSVIVFVDATFHQDFENLSGFVLAKIKVAHQSKAIVTLLISPLTLAVLVYVSIAAETADQVNTGSAPIANAIRKSDLLA